MSADDAPPSSPAQVIDQLSTGAWTAQALRAAA
jgi:hypothetical protein